MKTEKLLLASLIAAVVGCATFKAAEAPIIDVANATCKIAEAQPEAPSWVYFVCDVANATGNIVQHYTMRVPAAQAASFGAAHGPSSTSVTVTPPDAGK